MKRLGQIWTFQQNHNLLFSMQNKHLKIKNVNFNIGKHRWINLPKLLIQSFAGRAKHQPNTMADPIIDQPLALRMITWQRRTLILRINIYERRFLQSEDYKLTWAYQPWCLLTEAVNFGPWSATSGCFAIGNNNKNISYIKKMCHISPIILTFFSSFKIDNITLNIKLL